MKGEVKATLRPLFWQRYALTELSPAEWEALCDGCGTCCLHKFLDDPSQPHTVSYTDVACRLLDCKTGHCRDYANRRRWVTDCIELTAATMKDRLWLPNHCAYKRRYLGQSLPKWHPLLTQDPQLSTKQMQAAGIGVAGRCISETHIQEDDIETRQVRWVRVDAHQQ